MLRVKTDARESSPLSSKAPLKRNQKTLRHGEASDRKEASKKYVSTKGTNKKRYCHYVRYVSNRYSTIRTKNVSLS